MSRRGFLKIAGAGGAGVVAIGAAVQAGMAKSGHVRLAPVEGAQYSAGFLRFMKRARFRTPRAAMMAVRSQTTPYAIEWVEA